MAGWRCGWSSNLLWPLLRATFKLKQLKVSSHQSTVDPQVLSECDSSGMHFHLNLRWLLYGYLNHNRGALSVQTEQRKCVVQRWYSNLHEETDGTDNVALWQGMPLSGGINSFIQDCPKQQTHTHKHKQNSTNSLCPCVTVCKDRLMAVRWISEQPRPPSLTQSLLVQFAVTDCRSGEWFSAMLSKTFRIFFTMRNNFRVQCPSSSHRHTGILNCTKLHTTSSLHPCNSQTIITGTCEIFTSWDKHIEH